MVVTDAWHISVRFGPGVLRNGMDPLSFLHYLASLGEIIAITTLADAMPAADEMDPECCYLGFEIRFQTRASKAQIERVFDFVRDDCTLHILPPHSKIDEYLKLIDRTPRGQHAPRRDPRALRRPDARPNSTPASPRSPPRRRRGRNAGAARRSATSSSTRRSCTRRSSRPPPAGRPSVSEKKANEARMIRVHADKLDQLIDLVGELVIAGAGANLLAQRSGQSELMESTSVLLRLVEDIRDSALQLRMVQIGETFNRFNRVVRDASREMGKSIDLVITGAETELDKSVVEKLGDPLMHLVRNAIDHGIEAPALRAERGKPENGTVQLNAYHDSGSIVIEVIDDGGGLPRDKDPRQGHRPRG
jgi:two-component system chemotaxis sensor kinase CheA